MGNKAAGVVFIADGDKVLLVKRADSGEWGLPGGGVEPGETPEQAAMRECLEELGYTFNSGDLIECARVDNPDGVTFTCYIKHSEEFEPTLNDEHTESMWATPGQLPQPLFMATGMLVEQALSGTGMDRADDPTSARRLDVNGWYEIKNNPLSKVGVYPYLGKWISKDLDPNKFYNVYRPAEELSDPATLESFKLLPWVDNHAMLGAVPGGVAAEQKGVGGVLGQEIYFKDDTVYGNLKLFSSSHGATIDNGKNELSLGYRCIFEYAPGAFKGQTYDYVQRRIRGNHVASVDNGRMGASISVLDHLDHFSITFDSKDLQTMPTPAATDDTKAAPPAAEPAKDMSLSDISAAIKALMPLMTQMQQLLASQATPTAAVVDAAQVEGAAPAAAPAAAGTPAMDASDVAFQMYRSINERDKMAGEIAATGVGVFDHTDMTPGEVVKYGIEKLGITAAPGGEKAALQGYLQAVAKQPKARVFQSDTNVGTGLDGSDEPAEFLQSVVEQ